MERNHRGFTLVEMLIAVAVFSILMAIGVGGFAKALHTQREVAALAAAQSTAGEAIEQMAREMRTGYLFCHDPASMNLNATCLSACTINGNSWNCNGLIDFYNANVQDVDYRLHNGSLERSDTGAGGTFVPITGDNVRLTSLSFVIFGQLEGDHWPPRITILMGIAPSTTDPAVANDVIQLQTTVSSRDIDCAAGPGGSC